MITLSAKITRARFSWRRMGKTRAPETQDILTSGIPSVQDIINKREMRVEYCPTHMMLADYFRKTLMGKKFRELRNVIMGYKSILDLELKHLHKIKEHIGLSDKSD